MHDHRLGLGHQRLGIVAHGREITKAGLKPLGDRHLSGRAAQDRSGRPRSTHCPGSASIMSFHARASIISSIFGGSGRPRPGTIGTIERSVFERRAMAGEPYHACPLNGQNLTAKSLKGLRPHAIGGALRPTARNLEK